MDYIYDIVLNFQDEYYDFYEWQPTDKIVNIKRIPIYKIGTKDYLNIKNNSVTIERNTLAKQNKIFLITNGIEVMGIMVDSSGKVIKKSSLLFDENDEILEDRELIKTIDIKYKIDKKNVIKYISRSNKDKIKYLKGYFKKIDKIRDEYFLKYLYYDIYNDDEKDIDKVYDNLLNLARDNPTKMYGSIKKIELELKNFPNII